MTKKDAFYEPLFTSNERRDLAEAPPDPASLLSAEIDMVRVAIRRMFKIAKEQTGEEQVKTLNLLSLVSGRLAGLIRTQQQIRSGPATNDDLQGMLEAVLLEEGSQWPQV